MYPDFQASIANINMVAPFTKVLSTSTNTRVGESGFADFWLGGDIALSA